MGIIPLLRSRERQWDVFLYKYKPKGKAGGSQCRGAWIGKQLLLCRNSFYPLLWETRKENKWTKREDSEKQQCSRRGKHRRRGTSRGLALPEKPRNRTDSVMCNGEPGLLGIQTLSLRIGFSSCSRLCQLGRLSSPLSHTYQMGNVTSATWACSRDLPEGLGLPGWAPGANRAPQAPVTILLLGLHRLFSFWCTEVEMLKGYYAWWISTILW